MKDMSLIFQKPYLTTVALLKKLSIPITKIGDKNYITLIDIKDNAPELYRSLLEIDLLNS